jgi:hypothetical protein
VEVCDVVLDFVVVGNCINGRLELLGVTHLSEQEGLDKDAYITLIFSVDFLPVGVELDPEQPASVGDLSKVVAYHACEVEDRVGPPDVFNGSVLEFSREVVFELHGVVHKANGVSDAVTSV